MVTDLQSKKASFNTLAFQIRVDNLEYFRGKTLSKVFSIGSSVDNKPELNFSKIEIPQDIKEKLKAAFKTIFG
ncbi:hypothetical protein [Flavobacterium sp. NRK1]|uniref:hypothetical protein n=1 Tax=Flavobacterium sp. NRK1 TaxID=2954929 RepID=UPI0020923C3A|nr:hypothetical protein [Flavobacterium sp. NRK1]MCO6148167.1 hypothetical protein [Flavobacterium sp. NRK1]